MYITVGTVTVKTFETTKWNPDTKEREDIMPDEREYEIVAIDKHVHGIYEFAKLVEYWHQRLPYAALDFQFTSEMEW